MTDDEKIIRKALEEALAELDVKKYVDRNLEDMSFKASFDGKGIDESYKHIWAMILGATNLYISAMITAIAKLKASGFFKE